LTGAVPNSAVELTKADILPRSHSFSDLYNLINDGTRMNRLNQSFACLGLLGVSFLISIPQVHAMTGPTAIPIDGGPLGPLELSGGADGLFYGLTGTQKYSDSEGLAAPSTNNAGPKAVGAQFMNGLIKLQKSTGVLQATVEVGATNVICLGLGLTPSSVQSYSTGPLYAGYVTIAPTGFPFTVSVGQMTGLEGFEATQDYNNANIFLTQIAYVETGQARGVNINYTKGAINAQAFFSDGYDTGVFNQLQGLLAYTINGTNSVSIYYGGNLGKTGANANTYGNGNLAYDLSHVGAAPQFANSQMVGAYYSYTSGNLNLVPEVQYQYAKPQTSLRIQKGMTNLVATVLADYSFGNSPYSLGTWIEYFDQHESAADSANGLYWFYGPNASGEGISITPTWQHKDLFSRLDFGGLYLNRTSAYGLPKYGYGDQHNSSFEFTGLLEAGVLF
jgi:hypothetical protein